MKSSLSNMAYDYIAKAISSGEIATGSILSEQSLANNLKISRTPIREAVRRLKYEGVVEQVPRYGTIVCHPDRNRLKELYELREALECYAVEHAVEEMTPPVLQVLEELIGQFRTMAYTLRASKAVALEGRELTRFLEVDMTFHMLLLETAGNQQILKTVRESRALTGIFGIQREDHNLSILAKTYKRHAQIFKAIQRRDRTKARHYLSCHIQESAQQALAHCDQIHARTRNHYLHTALQTTSC